MEGIESIKKVNNFKEGFKEGNTYWAWIHISIYNLWNASCERRIMLAQHC